MLYGSTLYGTCLKSFRGGWLRRPAVVIVGTLVTVVLIRRWISIIIRIRIVIAAVFSQNTGYRSKRYSGYP